MSMNILPGEFHVMSDRYVIRTRVPMEMVTDDMVLARVKNANLTAGDSVTVQCMNHEYDTLIAEGQWRVVSRKDSMVTKEINDRETRSFMEAEFAIAQVGGWWEAAAPLPVVGPGEPEIFTTKRGKKAA